MKSLLVVVFLALPLLAQEEKTPSKDELVAMVLEERDQSTFEKRMAEAKKAGVSPQILVEARFLFLVDHGDLAGLAALGPQLEAQLPKFRVADSAIFAVREDFEAIIQYSKAMGALGKGNQAGFKKHITEAFWLSPSQAPVFGRHIEDWRLEKAMKSLKFDFNKELSIQMTDGKVKAKTKLSTILGEAPGLLLHFWTPWSQESLDSIPDYLTTAAELTKNQIPTTSILLAGNEEARQAGDAFLKDLAEKKQGRWLVDDAKGSTANLFRLQQFPTVVLLSKDGTILYNGHPGAPDFWAKLKDLAPLIKRPDHADPKQ